MQANVWALPDKVDNGEGSEEERCGHDAHGVDVPEHGLHHRRQLRVPRVVVGLGQEGAARGQVAVHEVRALVRVVQEGAHLVGESL